MGTAVHKTCLAEGCPREASVDGTHCGALICRMKVRWQEHATADGIDESAANLGRAHVHLLEAARRFALADARPRSWAGDGTPLGEGEREQRAVKLMSAASAFADAERVFERRKAAKP